MFKKTKFFDFIKKRKNAIYGILMFIMVLSLFFYPSNLSEVKEVSFVEFQQMVKDNKVKSIEIQDDLVIAKTEEGVQYVTSNPKDPTFIREMMEADIKVKEVKPSMFLSLLVQMVICALFFLVFFYFISRSTSKLLKNKGIDNTEIKPYEGNNKGRVATFSDVAGIDEAKQELWEIVDFLKNPSRFMSMGIRPPKGVILYGPPGTGKTLLARAVAGEAGVPFYSMSGSDFVEMFVGVGAMRVRQLFKKARESSPCVIFIDEIDAVARRRSGAGGGANDERDQTLNALLTEMDGFHNNMGIVVIAATNRLDVLDKAILRPGRFDRSVEVSPPDLQGRKAILRIHAKNKPLDHTVDLDRLAQRTVGFTGADLENLLNESAICALRNNRKVITWEDIDEGFNRVIVGMKKVRNPMTDEEKRIVAFHEAGHAVVTRLMAKHPVEKVTIAPTGKALGYVLKTPQEFHLRSKQQLFNEICIALGGRVAEEIMFGKENITNGATQDIKQATQIAYEMIFSYGMSELGPLALDTNAEDMWLRVSDDVKNKAFAEMQTLLDRAQTETHEFIQENIDSLKRLAFKLMEVETIDGKDLDKVLNPEPNSQNIIILEGGEEISEEKVVV